MAPTQTSREKIWLNYARMRFACKQQQEYRLNDPAMRVSIAPTFKRVLSLNIYS